MNELDRGPGSPRPGQGSDDVETLHSLGYAQELLRRMGGFSNFAISFSIICILSGGINSIAQGISGVGGAALGIGWPLGCLLTLVFGLGMAQIASAFPTAGGLYHWASILGGRFLGWLTAWFNLFGLITVLGAINVGTFTFFSGAFGIEASYQNQLIFMVLVTGSHALFNHLGIRLTSLLTDLSGFIILGGAVLLALALFAYAPSWDLSRLVTFANYSGLPPGDSAVWPQTDSILILFLLGLLLPIYTITGYDASAHTAEETRSAARSVPWAIINAIIFSGLFGWLFLAAFVLAVPDMQAAANQGWGSFFWVIDQTIPEPLKLALYVIILVAQYLCGLATVTSCSRMIFAFARDGGLPFSDHLRKVSPRWRTPVPAIWTGAILAVLFTAQTSVYSTIVSVTVIFLYISYGLPLACALFAHGRSWTKMGPFDLGAAFKPIALLAIIIDVLIFFIGVQPPNDGALIITVLFVIVTGIVWLAFEHRRFKGPPVGATIAERQAAIREAEIAVGERSN